MLYSCTDMAIVSVKGLRFRHEWLTMTLTVLCFIQLASGSREVIELQLPGGIDSMSKMAEQVSCERETIAASNTTGHSLTN